MLSQLLKKKVEPRSINMVTDTEMVVDLKKVNSLNKGGHVDVVDPLEDGAPHDELDPHIIEPDS